MKAQTGIIITVIAVIAVIMVAFLGAIMWFGPTPGEIAAEKEDTLTAITIAAAGACDENDQGYYRPAVYNPLNTSGTEYIAVTQRIYSIETDANGEKTEVFYGSVTTQTSGVAARAATGTIQITCTDRTTGNPIEYVAYSPASDGSMTSMRYEFTAKADIVKEFAIPQQAGLIFKMYDEENRGDVYGGAVTDATTWMASGSTFYSTTSNSTGLTVDTDGTFEYTVSVKTNATAAIDTQYEDQALYLYVNIAEQNEWNELSLNLGGSLSSIDFPNSKVSNAGYDFAYSLGDIHLGSVKNDLTVAGQALSGVNPSDDVVLAFGTSGYVKQTVGSGMILDTNKDDSARTTVYTLQTVTLSIV